MPEDPAHGVQATRASLRRNLELLVTLGALTSLNPSHEPFAQLLSWLGYQPKELLCVKALSCDRQQPLHAFALRNQRNWVFRSTQPRHALQHFVWLQASHQDHSPPSQAGWNESSSFDSPVQVPDQTRSPRRTSLNPFRGLFQAWSYDRPSRLHLHDALTLSRATSGLSFFESSRHEFACVRCKIHSI